MLKREASEVADYNGPGFATRGLYGKAVDACGVPSTFAHKEPNSESLEAIREGDAFLASGEKGRFDNGADLIAAALA